MCGSERKGRLRVLFPRGETAKLSRAPATPVNGPVGVNGYS